MSTSGSSTTVRPRGGSALSAASGVAVAAVLVYTVMAVVMSIIDRRTTSSGDLGLTTGLVFALILGAYLLVILRAPSGGRWVFFALLALMLGMAFSTALGASHADNERVVTSQPSIAGLLVVSALIVLPLLYMRLRLPKAKR